VAAARIEKLGIPTAIIQRKELMEATLSAVMGQGLPPEAPCVLFEFPLFLVGSDLAPLSKRMVEIIERLTSWESERKIIGMIRREPVTVAGKDYADAFKNLQFLFLRKKWADGTTVTPPTSDQVDWILTGTDHDRGEPVGEGKGAVMPKGGILTYEVLATCLAMAGGRPEYLPVLAAACYSIVDRENMMLTSSISTYPGILVNGPMAKQIRLSSGFGLFGPDPVRPSGTAIGRALWFILQNVGGLIPGTGTIAQYGEIRHGCLCFAENESALPSGWTTYSEEYHSRPKGINSATYFLVRGGGVRGFTHRGRGDEPSFKEEMLESFHRVASVIKATPTSGIPSDQMGTEGLLLYPALICNNMANIGWTKEKIKKQLAEELYFRLAEVKDKSGILRACQQKGVDIDKLPERFMLYTDPQRIRLAVAGGDHPSRGMWIPNLDVQGNVEIELPRRWKSLLTQAAKDLGPPNDDD
jgi:hypothetical protein